MGLRTGRLDVPLIGYARVSTVDQDLALQRDALHQVGCTRIFEDFGVSGAKTERPALTAALAYIREGDVLVVWKLDRLPPPPPPPLFTLSEPAKTRGGCG